MKESKARSIFHKNKDYIIPHGGCGEFGMNMSSLIFNGVHILVDTGVMFPDYDNIGVDGIFPKVEDFFSEVSVPDAIIITHGHEDHIGAFSYIISQYPQIKVYTSSWTKELLLYKLIYNRVEESQTEEDKNLVDLSQFLEENIISGQNIKKEQARSKSKISLDQKYNIYSISEKQILSVGGLKIEFFFLDHSIPQSFGMQIKSPERSYFYTGDFRFNKKNFYKKINPDYLLVDSTNACRVSSKLTEAQIVVNFKHLIKKHENKKLIITTFSSNFERIAGIIKACTDLKRQFCFVGSGLVKTVGIALRLKLIHQSDLKYYIPVEDLGSKQKNIVVIASGCQGEFLSGFSRIVEGRSKKIRIEPQDGFVFSSRVIPGREKALSKIRDKIIHQGGIIYSSEDYHRSGHADKEELEALIKELNCKRVIPIHGSYEQLQAVVALAEKMGVESDIVESGFAYKVSDRLEKVASVELELNFIDSYSSHLLSRQVIRERTKIGSLGAVIFFGVYSFRHTGWIVPCSLDEVGLAPLEKHVKKEIEAKIEKKITSTSSVFNPEKLKEEIRVLIRKRCEKVYNKKPVVIVKLEFKN